MMLKKIILLSLSSVITILFSCKAKEEVVAQTENTPKNIIFSEVKSGTNSSFLEKKHQVIKSNGELIDVWNIAMDNYMNKPASPIVDFKNKQVILVAMGEKTNGGYSVKVKSIIEATDNIEVTFEESAPGTTCMTTSVMSYPYQMVEMSKSDKEITFVLVEKVYECEK